MGISGVMEKVAGSELYQPCEISILINKSEKNMLKTNKQQHSVHNMLKIAWLQTKHLYQRVLVSHSLVQSTIFCNNLGSLACGVFTTTNGGLCPDSGFFNFTKKGLSHIIEGSSATV